MRYFQLLLPLLLAGCAAANGQDAPRLRLFSAQRVKAEPAPEPPVIELPTLDLPASVDGDVSTFIKIRATTNGTHVRWVAMDKGLAVFPGEMLKDSTSTVVMAYAAGQYRLLAYTALMDVPSDPVVVMVTVHGAQPPPVPPQPIPPPIPFPVPPIPVPPVPPVPAAVSLANLWVVTIDDVTARTPSVAKVLGDMTFWNGLRAQGVRAQQMNITDPAAKLKFYQQLNANTSLQYPSGVPCVVLMDGSKTEHNWLNQNPGDLRLPASTDDLKALINRYVGGQLR